MGTMQAMGTLPRSARALSALVLGGMLLVFAGCAEKPAITKPIEPAQGGKRFTSLDIKEGEHAAKIGMDVRKGIRSASVNILIDKAKEYEKKRAAAGDKNVRGLVVEYRVLAYDPGDNMLRMAGASMGIGKSVMRTEITFKDAGKSIGRFQIDTTVKKNDLLQTTEQQHGDYLWQEVWEIFTDNYYLKPS